MQTYKALNIWLNLRYCDLRSPKWRLLLNSNCLQKARGDFRAAPEQLKSFLDRVSGSRLRHKALNLIRAMVNNIFRSLSVSFPSPFLGHYFHQGTFVNLICACVSFSLILKIRLKIRYKSNVVKPNNQNIPCYSKICNSFRAYTLFLTRLVSYKNERFDANLLK